VRDRGTVIQKKTGRPVQFEIMEQTRASIHDWLSKVELRLRPGFRDGVEAARARTRTHGRAWRTGNWQAPLSSEPLEGYQSFCRSAPPSSGALNVCRRPNCRAPHSRPRHGRCDRTAE
jgi:hypothetical protein